MFAITTFLLYLLLGDRYLLLNDVGVIKTGPLTQLWTIDYDPSTKVDGAVFARFSDGSPVLYIIKVGY